MELTRPTTLDELIADGAIAQADIDATSAPIEAVEVNGFPADVPDAPVPVRIHRRGRAPETTTAIRIAEINSETWTWKSQRIGGLDIPELQDPPSPRLYAAARTVCNNGQIVVVNGLVLALPFAQVSPLSVGLTRGIGAVDPVYTKRALTSYAYFCGADAREVPGAMEFSTGDRMTLEEGWATGTSLTLRDIRSDAFYIVSEYQLMLSGRFPGPVALDQTGTRASLGGTLVAARVLATIGGGVFRWVDEQVRQLGQAYGIAPLVRDVPEGLAYRWNLPAVGAHIVGWPTQTIVGDKMVALSGPQLELGPVFDAAVRSTLQTPAPRDLDYQRAVASYVRLRGINAQGEYLYAGGNPIRVHADWNGLEVS